MTGAFWWPDHDLAETGTDHLHEPLLHDHLDPGAEAVAPVDHDVDPSPKTATATAGPLRAGRRVVVVGEAGIGETTLLRAASANHPPAVFAGNALGVTAAQFRLRADAFGPGPSRCPPPTVQYRPPPAPAPRHVALRPAAPALRAELPAGAEVVRPRLQPGTVSAWRRQDVHDCVPQLRPRLDRPGLVDQLAERVPADDLGHLQGRVPLTGRFGPRQVVSRRVHAGCAGTQGRS